jgi:hypothetical protein
LESALLEAGLAGRVRVGVPLPVDSPGRSRTASPREEGDLAPLLSLDGLLRPLERTGQGRLIEVAGGLSSGKTAVACRMAVGTTRRGELVGWVDLPNALDPRSLRRGGAELRSLLWARPRGVSEAFRCTELLLRTGFALVILDLENAPPKRLARLGPVAWTRLLRVTRGARATALVLVPDRTAGAVPTLGLFAERRASLFEGGLFEGIESFVTVVRDRAGPPGAEHAFRTFQRL